MRRITGYQGETPAGASAMAWRDVQDGILRWRIAATLAHEDIGDQHRRTLLGPLWLLINYLAFACTFIFVFQRGGAGGDTQNYAAYVATGLLVWFYIMETLTQSVSLFVREESFIKGTTLPLTVYILRLFLQSLIRSSFAIIGCLGILAFSGTALTLAWVWSVLGILMILLVSPAAIAAVAFLGAYFPDSQFVVANLMRIGMFLTPVFWAHETANEVRHVFYYYNPFTYFLEIVRAPILEGTFPAAAFLLCATVGLGLWVLAIVLLGLFGRRVVFAL